ncbi:MAG: outer membrane lipoprotein-sorting protein [bacterium]
MKRIIAAFIALLVFAAKLQAQELSPKQIIQKVDSTERVQSSEGIIKQTIITSGGKKRTLEMKAYSKDENDKQLMIYTGPKRVKGDKILMLNDGDDIWFYTPKTDRVRHLASHARRQKVQGSDFAYEDMASGTIEEDYTYKLLDEEKIDGAPCYKFELIPTESGPHYSKLLYWADKEEFITRRIDYYEDGELLKRLNCYDIKMIDGHWTAMRLVMANLKEGGETVMEMVEIKYNVSPDEKLFTARNLKRR